MVDTVPASTARHDRWVAFLCGVLIALAAAWNCREVPGFDFLAWDDDINIVFNPHLGPPTTQNVAWMLTDASYMRRYVPVGWLGFSAIYSVSGLSPDGYHVVNVGLHALNAALLYLVLWRLVARFCPATPTSGRTASATIGALLWALHPLRAETVGWASGLLYGLSGA